MRLLLRPFLGQTNAFRRPGNRVSHAWTSTLSARCAIWRWFQISNRLLISQATPFVDCLEERKIVGRLGLLHCSQPSCIMLQHVTTLCACHGHLPSIGSIWRCQASHGWRKKWSGWNQTNWTGGYGPVLLITFQRMKKYIRTITVPKGA